MMIGVFTAELDDSYQAAAWEGISARAEREKIGLICFLGSRLNSPVVPEKSANRIYDLANENSLEGLIVISSAISTYLEIDDLRRFLTARCSSPLVSIGSQVPGVPSVTVAGREGLTAVVQHLIDEHERGCFGLIMGPEGHAEAEERKAAFYDTLRANRIDFDARL